MVAFFYRESHRRERRRELVRVVRGGLGVLVFMAWVAFFTERELRDPRRFGMFDTFLVLLISP